MENIRIEREPEMIPPMEQQPIVREPMMAPKPIIREPIVTPYPMPVKTQTRRRKRCPKGKRRNPKTRRCNKKCPAGYKRNKSTRRCVKQ